MSQQNDSSNTQSSGKSDAVNTVVNEAVDILSSVLNTGVDMLTGQGGNSDSDGNQSTNKE